MNKIVKHDYLNTAMRLPWKKDKDVPHCIIDVCRTCNIKCRTCYNSDEPCFRSLEEIENDLKIVKKQRNVQSVLIVGGEPLLHPQIFDIIRLIRSYGYYVEMCSNASLLDDEMAEKLSNAGLNFIICHIESQQKRNDLPIDSSKEQRKKLREEKVKLCAKHNIEAGMVITGFKDNPDEIKECLDILVNSKDIHFFVVSSYRNTLDMGKMKGNLKKGIISENIDYIPDSKCFTMDDVANIARNYFNNSCYNFMGSCEDINDPRWISYRIISAIDKNGMENLVFTPTLFEKLYIQIYRFFTGRYIFYIPQKSSKVKSLVFFNALFGNWKNLGFLIKNIKKQFVSKTFIVQIFSEVRDGKLIHCACCVDAHVKNGKLVPTCIADNIIDVE